MTSGRVFNMNMEWGKNCRGKLKDAVAEKKTEYKHLD
jgi:hypothetical protein